MYCRNYTVTVSRVLCREVYYTVSFFGRVHYQLEVLLYVYIRTYVCTYVRTSGSNDFIFLLRFVRT